MFDNSFFRKTYLLRRLYDHQLIWSLTIKEFCSNIRCCLQFRRFTTKSVHSKKSCHWKNRIFNCFRIQLWYDFINTRWIWSVYIFEIQGPYKNRNDSCHILSLFYKDKEEKVQDIFLQLEITKTLFFLSRWSKKETNLIETMCMYSF